MTGGGDTGTILNRQMKEYASKGEPLTDPTLFEKWYSCFESPQTANDTDLAMVDFTVIPLWNIVSRMDANKGEKLKDYIVKVYLK